MTTLKKSIEIIQQQLRGEITYRNGWKYWIGKSFKDAYIKYRKDTAKQAMSLKNIYIIIDKATDDFIDLLTKESEIK